jgi:hypothetical protein
MDVKVNQTELQKELFDTLKQLKNQELTGEKLKEELERSRGVTNVAKYMINNGNLMLQVFRAVDSAIDNTKNFSILSE